MIETLPIRQCLTLPRGIEPKGSPDEGTVLFDSPNSGDTYDRAVRTAEFAADHPELVRAIFVSQESFAIPPWRHCKGSEAEAAAAVAVEHGLNPDLVCVRKQSRSTLGGFLEALDHIDPDDTLAVILHEDHEERAMKLGRLVLPRTRLVAVLADNPDRQSENPTASSYDALAAKVYDLALRGVQPGDIPTLARRERIVVAGVSLAASGLAAVKAANNLLRPAVAPAHPAT